MPKITVGTRSVLKLLFDVCLRDSSSSVKGDNNYLTYLYTKNTGKMMTVNLWVSHFGTYSTVCNPFRPRMYNTWDGNQSITQHLQRFQRSTKWLIYWASSVYKRNFISEYQPNFKLIAYRCTVHVHSRAIF